MKPKPKVVIPIREVRARAVRAGTKVSRAAIYKALGAERLTPGDFFGQQGVVVDLLLRQFLRSVKQRPKNGKKK